MEHLDFVLWVCLWPVSMYLADYVSVLSNKSRGWKPKTYNEETEKFFGKTMMGIWIVVAFFLYAF